MSRITVIILIFFCTLIVFNKKIVSYYYINKFSNWVERPVKIDKLNFNYSGHVKIEGIKILNNSENYYKNIFRAEKIEIHFDMDSIFSDLILIKSLYIYNPEFFLVVKIKKDNQNINYKKEVYEDNIGLAKKLMKIHQTKFGQKKIEILIFW